MKCPSQEGPTPIATVEHEVFAGITETSLPEQRSDDRVWHDHQELASEGNNSRACGLARRAGWMNFITFLTMLWFSMTRRQQSSGNSKERNIQLKKILFQLFYWNDTGTYEESHCEPYGKILGLFSPLVIQFCRRCVKLGWPTDGQATITCPQLYKRTKSSPHHVTIVSGKKPLPTISVGSVMLHYVAAWSICW